PRRAGDRRRGALLFEKSPDTSRYVARSARETTKGRASEISPNPFSPQRSAQALVESDRMFVPIEHGPLPPAAPAPLGNPRQLGQKRAAGAPPALLRQHEKVFQVEARASLEGGELEVVDCEPAVGATPTADERLEVAAFPEAVAADLPAGGNHLVRQPLV